MQASSNFQGLFSNYFACKNTSEANLTYFTKLITSQLEGSHLYLERAKRRVDITSYIQSIKFNFILENNAAIKISKQSKPYIFFAVRSSQATEIVPNAYWFVVQALQYKNTSIF